MKESGRYKGDEERRLEKSTKSTNDRKPRQQSGHKEAIKAEER